MYNFEGVLDIRQYFKLAQKAGLLVLLRPGPFIDAEVDMVCIREPATFARLTCF